MDRVLFQGVLPIAKAPVPGLSKTNTVIGKPDDQRCGPRGCIPNEICNQGFLRGSKVRIQVNRLIFGRVFMVVLGQREVPAF